MQNQILKKESLIFQVILTVLKSSSNVAITCQSQYITSEWNCKHLELSLVFSGTIQKGTK